MAGFHLDEPVKCPLARTFFTADIGVAITLKMTSFCLSVPVSREPACTIPAAGFTKTDFDCDFGLINSQASSRCHNSSLLDKFIQVWVFFEFLKQVKRGS